MTPNESGSGLIDRIIHSSFRHRTVVVMIVALAVAFGIAAYQQMPRNVYPDITIPVFTIVTENEAMATEEIEAMITRPMESAMNGLPGVRRIRSQTTQGMSTVIAEFDLETEFWRARQFVTERMAQVAGQLPPGSEPPIISSATTRLAEVYEVAIEGDLPLTELRELAEWQVRYGLLTVPGVADIVIMGGSLLQYRVTIDPAKLRSYGIGLCDVEDAIVTSNENAAGGFVSTGPTEFIVRGIGRYEEAADIENTVIVARNGAPIYVRNVADVTEGTAIRRGIATKDTKEAVLALIIKQPNADTVKVVDGIERALAEMKETLPKGVRLVSWYDQTHLIKESLTDVTRAIMVGSVLVILVLLLFLGRFRTTLIVAVSLPLSVIIAGAMMRKLGVGINTMSLGGLAIAVGIMVDASIIMVENIYHRLHQQRAAIASGEAKERVAHRAAMEVGRPIAFATFIIVAVFLPLFMMGGIEGLLFRPLAVTVASSMLVALALSLIFTPMMSLRFLRPKDSDDPEGEVRFVKWIKRAYVPALEYALHHRWIVIIVTFALLVPTAVGVMIVGKDFMPKLDEGALMVSMATPPETSLEECERITRQIEEIFRANPNVETTIRRAGHSERAIGCVLPVNIAEIIANLKPRDKRKDSTAKILADVRAQMDKVPGVAFAFTQPFQNKIDESIEGTPSPLQVKLFGPDLKVLAEKGAQLKALVGKTRGTADVRMDQVTGTPQLQVRINREAAARHGVSVGEISEVVRLAIGGADVTQVWRDQRSYGVFMRLADEARSDAEAIGNIMVDTPSGIAVPLSQVATVVTDQGPNVVWREAMNRRVSIDSGIQGRDLVSVVTDIREGVKSFGLPEGYFVVYGGQYQNQQRAMRALLMATAVALLIVFMLLYIALGSATQAGMILATVPSAFIGGVASLLITGESLNVSSAVGFIALFGIAVQNSLVLLTQTQGFIAEGRSKEEAVRLASVQRLRPKLMTASCAALGVVPILLSGGVGAQIERPLAIVMVGGLVTSTLFTLLVLPAVYLVFDQARTRVKRRFSGAKV